VSATRALCLLVVLAAACGPRGHAAPATARPGPASAAAYPLLERAIRVGPCRPDEPCRRPALLSDEGSSLAGRTAAGRTPRPAEHCAGIVTELEDPRSARLRAPAPPPGTPIGPAPRLADRPPPIFVTVPRCR